MLDRFRPKTNLPPAEGDETLQQPGSLLARFSSSVKAPGTEETPPAFETAEEPLPEGAQGWDPFGNPYFGEGISGIMKRWKYNFTKDVQPVSDEDWQDLKDRWKANLDKYHQYQEALNKGGPVSSTATFEATKGVFGMGAEAVGKAWQAGTAQGSLLSPILKGVGSTVTSLGELFSIPAQKVEQGFGAWAGVKEAAAAIESPLPRLDANFLTQAIENSPVGLVYDFTRIALSSSEDKWDYAGQKIEEGWQSGRIYYSTLFDKTLKAQFLQEYRMGGDPALIAMKLQNPLVEVIGQAVLDPFNLVGVFAKAAKTAKQLDAAKDAVTASGLLKTEKGVAAMKAMQEASDEASGARALTQLVEAQKEAKAAMLKGSKVLNVGYSVESLTTTSRQNAIISKGKTMLGNMALVLKQQGMSYDGVAEAVLAGIRSVSDNDEDIRLGLAVLSKLPNANMWLADDYLESFHVLNRMMTNAEGVIDGGRLKNLMKVKSPEEFARQAAKLMVAAAKTEFHEVTEMGKAHKLWKAAQEAGGTVGVETERMAQAFEKLPFHVKFLNRINDALETATGPINRVLFPAYFNLQGGVAVRNVLNNQELIFLDKGPTAWFKDGKYWSVEGIRGYLTDIYGALPESTHGFKSLVSSMTDRPAWGFGKLMESGEEAGATRIVGASVRDTFKKMLPKAMPDLRADIETGALTERQAKKLLSLVERNHYNVDKAIEQFRSIYKVGSVEDWRNLNFVGDYEKAGLEGLGYWDEIEDLANRGVASTDDIEAAFAKINQSIDSRAELAAQEAIGISPDHPAIEAWGDLMKAAEEGHLDPDEQQLFTAIMEAAEQSRLEYQTLLDDVAQKAMNSLNMEGKAQDAMRIGQEMNRVRETVRKAGPVTARQAHEVTQDAWRWAEEIKAIRKPKPEQLVEFWNKVGLDGDIPADLDKRSLLKALFEHRFEKVSELWNHAFDAVVGESETVLKQMEGIVDTADLKSMSTYARYVTQKAQALRMETFHSGGLKIIPRKDLEFVAKQYGVTLDEIVTAINNRKKTSYKTLSEIPTSDILKVIKQARDERGLAELPVAAQAAKTAVAAGGPSAIGIEEAAKVPVSKLPDPVQERFQGMAKRMLSDLTAGQAGKKATVATQGAEELAGFGMTNVHWYRKIYEEKGLEKPALIKALEKIVADQGKDKGVNVERMKEMILDFVRYGDAQTGTPPDLYMLKQLGVDEKTMQEALDTFNDITHQQMTLEDALRSSTPMEEMLHAEGMPYFDEAGNLVDPNAVAVPPPHPTGTTPTVARAWNESARGAKYVLDNIKNEILRRWGKTNAEYAPSPALENVLQKVKSTLDPRIGEIKAIALRVAEEDRNFTLLNYGERTYGDMALAKILPFHFWYGRQYRNWIPRLAENPNYIANYGRYMAFLETQNSELPDWYKHQIQINPFAGKEQLKGKEFLGIPLDHPLYANLEATFNPLYGLTGTDYNDPVKRNNWATATIDDMGKLGPTMYAPIQLGIAALLYRNGETDVAARWANRLFPETVQAKALTSTLFGKPVELDPAVLFFSKGIDPQERGRMGYAAAELIKSGQFTPEDVMMQFQAQEGAAWDAAYQMAVQSRAASAFTSYFLGVGFKPRSTNDVMVEDMYTNMNKLYAVADMMEPEQYRLSWEQLRSQFPDGFVDAVLLARKGGDKRDAALAYEVLNRIPPGNMSEALAAIGLSNKEIEKFYSSKGFADRSVKFTKQEKDRFMAAVIDLAAMLKIPDAATRTEWTQAKATYSGLYKAIAEEMGEDIWDKVSQYYDLKDDNYWEAQKFGQMHPEIFAAQQLKRQAVLSDPILSAYYASIETVEAYLDGKTRQQLSDKYGAEIYDIQTGYYNASDPRGYLRAHPELKQFWTEKHALETETEKAFYVFANLLPQGKPAQFQEGYAPQSYTQEQLYKAFQAQAESQVPSWDEISMGMPEWLQTEIADYAQMGAPLSKRATKEMDYLANVGGYYGADELLRLSVLSIGTGAGAGQGGGLLERFR